MNAEWPARPLAIGLVEHEHAHAPLAGGVRRRHTGIAGADHDDVVALLVDGAA